VKKLIVLVQHKCLQENEQTSRSVCLPICERIPSQKFKEGKIFDFWTLFLPRGAVKVLRYSFASVDLEQAALGVRAQHLLITWAQMEPRRRTKCAACTNTFLETPDKKFCGVCEEKAAILQFQSQSSLITENPPCSECSVPMSECLASRQAGAGGLCQYCSAKRLVKQRREQERKQADEQPGSVAASANGAPIRVHVKELTGRTTTIDFVQVKGMIAYEIMELVTQHTKIPADQQTLVYAGNRLHPEDALESLQLQNESTLHLVLRLRGS
jgi:DNA-directed RNA polymerase subunit RPC12/RpoP